MSIFPSESRICSASSNETIWLEFRRQYAFAMIQADAKTAPQQAPDKKHALQQRRAEKNPSTEKAGHSPGAIPRLVKNRAQ
mmetsp:Transcript_34723/g.91583  ORF Transcript_34723/g.91583 Transcript_34723/m.91583 type:complete len:81 (+) Transcript_34723:237-479(+)